MKINVFKRKTIRKIVLFFIFLPSIATLGTWFYDDFFTRIDASEVDRYYDLLTKHGKKSKGFVLSLGIKEDESLQVVADRLKKVMGLEEYEIWIGHHNDPEKLPAEIKDMGFGIMGITMYSGITEKREEINLLVHELGHIYVWNLDKAILKGYDEEKLVDTSGIFLGLGIFMLNGLTENVSFIPGSGEYESMKNFFGYLYPAQFGYLLARYAQEHGIPKGNITPFLNSTGRKYFIIGYTYLKRENAGAKKDQKNLSAKSGPEISGLYWCQACGYAGSVSLTKKLKDLKCPNCGQLLKP